MRILAAAFTALILLMYLVGCSGGDGQHSVSTGQNGSLSGMVLTPTPQSLGIGVDSNFYLDWRDGTFPPKSFAVSVQAVDNTDTAKEVLTRIDMLSRGHYRIVPVENLPTKTFVMVTVNGSGQSVNAIYLTAPSAPNLPQKAFVSPGDGKHIVTVP